MTLRPIERVNSMDCSKLRYDTLFHAILVACEECAVSSFTSWMRRHIQLLTFSYNESTTFPTCESVEIAASYVSCVYRRQSERRNQGVNGT